MRRSFAALYERIYEAGVMPAGAPFTMYNTHSAPWDVDVCVPVATPMRADPGFQYLELPATRVATLLHTGPCELIERAYYALESYIGDSGLEMSGSPREIYGSGPETPPEQIETLLEWPIR